MDRYTVEPPNIIVILSEAKNLQLFVAAALKSQPEMFRFAQDDVWTPEDSNINAPHARANPGCDLPRNRAGLFSQFRAGNLLAAIAPH
jgi:hypothetical protein